MIDDPDFVPFTRTVAWSQTSDCFVRPLLPDDPELCTAYGVLGAKQITYLTMGGLEESGATADQVHERAIANLLARRGKPEWSVKEVGDVAVMVRSGDELVASDVLNAKGMRKLGAFLKSQTVYLGMPSLFTMVASANGALLAGIVAGLHHDAERERRGPLSARVMTLVNGRPTGVHAGAVGAHAVALPRGDADLARVIARGVASVSALVERARGGTAPAALGEFWRGFNRQLGAAEGRLGQVAAAAEAACTEFAEQLAAMPPAVAHVEALAGTARAALPGDDYQRFARAVVAATTALGQAGTGFFGIGRKLPEGQRLLVMGITGVLGIEAASAGRA